jgi:hypothetical protein
MPRTISPVLSAIVALVVLTAPARSAPPKNIEGPFRATAMAFYVVHDGGPLSVTLRAHNRNDSPGARLLCRFFNAGEKLVEWKFHRFEAGTPRAEYLAEFGEEAPAGVYQVRCSLSGPVEVDLRTRPARSFGLMPMRSRLRSVARDQFAGTWVYVPEGAEHLKFRRHGPVSLKITPREGEQISLGSKKGTWTVPLERGDTVLKLDLLIQPDDWCFAGLGGFPVILCPDPETARAIHASLVEAPDGRRFAHRFQIRMREWIRELDPAELEWEPVDLRAYQDEMLEDPRAGAALLHRWSPLRMLRYVAQSQDLDPASPDYGECLNPAVFAAVLSVDKPYNPYHGSEVLKKRLLLAMFQHYLGLRENDTFRGGWNPYSGGDALRYMEPATAFGLGAPAVEPESRSLWFEAARRTPDRFAFYIESCANQSAHWPVIFHWLHRVSGERGYSDLARNLQQRFAVLAAEHGYQREANGPDATYQGLAACNQALYYRMSGDPAAKEALRNVYGLFNHTVAPEPDAARFGASNFAHRTAGSWTHPQYNGGRNLMQGALEEVALWQEAPPTEEELRASIRERLRTAPKPFEEVYKPGIRYCTMVWSRLFTDVLYPSKRLPGEHRLPVLEAENFTRRIGGEFTFVRRPAYYAALYHGSPMPEWMQRRRTLDPENPRSVYSWNPVQGLSMFWTPGFGNAVLSTSWNGDAVQMLRADIGPDKCSFPDYWSLETDYDPEAGLLTLRNAMVGLPAHLTRRIRFGQTKVEQQLQLRFEETVEVRRLYEQVPLFSGKENGLRILYQTEDGWTKKEPAQCRSLWLGNAVGEGVELEFSRPVGLELGPTSHYRDRTESREEVTALRLMFVRKFQAGDALEFSYTLSPRSRGQLQEGR